MSLLKWLPQGDGVAEASEKISAPSDTLEEMGVFKKKSWKAK